MLRVLARCLKQCWVCQGSECRGLWGHLLASEVGHQAGVFWEEEAHAEAQP